MTHLVATVWLCVAWAGPEGTLLDGWLADYSAGVQVHTTGSVPAGCSYYRVVLNCELVYDRWDDRFTRTYLCGGENND